MLIKVLLPCSGMGRTSMEESVLSMTIPADCDSESEYSKERFVVTTSIRSY